MNTAKEVADALEVVEEQQKSVAQQIKTLFGRLESIPEAAEDAKSIQLLLSLQLKLKVDREAIEHTPLPLGELLGQKSR